MKKGKSEPLRSLPRDMSLKYNSTNVIKDSINFPTSGCSSSSGNNNNNNNSTNSISIANNNAAGLNIMDNMSSRKDVSNNHIVVSGSGGGGGSKKPGNTAMSSSVVGVSCKTSVPPDKGYSEPLGILHAGPLAIVRGIENRNSGGSSSVVTPNSPQQSPLSLCSSSGGNASSVEDPIYEDGLNEEELRQIATRQQHQIQIQHEEIAHRHQKLQSVKSEIERNARTKISPNIVKLKEIYEHQKIKLKSLRNLKNQVNQNMSNFNTLKVDITNFQTIINNKKTELKRLEKHNEKLREDLRLSSQSSKTVPAALEAVIRQKNQYMIPAKSTTCSQIQVHQSVPITTPSVILPEASTSRLVVRQTYPANQTPSTSAISNEYLQQQQQQFYPFIQNPQQQQSQYLYHISSGPSSTASSSFSSCTPVASSNQLHQLQQQQYNNTSTVPTSIYSNSNISSDISAFLPLSTTDCTVISTISGLPRQPPPLPEHGYQKNKSSKSNSINSSTTASGNTKKSASSTNNNINNPSSNSNITSNNNNNNSSSNSSNVNISSHSNCNSNTNSHKSNKKKRDGGESGRPLAPPSYSDAKLISVKYSMLLAYRNSSNNCIRTPTSSPPVLRRRSIVGLPSGKMPSRFASRNTITNVYTKKSNLETLEKYKKTASEIYKAQLSKFKSTSSDDIRMEETGSGSCSGNSQSTDETPLLIRDMPDQSSHLSSHIHQRALPDGQSVSSVAASSIYLGGGIGPTVTNTISLHHQHSLQQQQQQQQQQQHIQNQEAASLCSSSSSLSLPDELEEISDPAVVGVANTSNKHVQVRDQDVEQQQQSIVGTDKSEEDKTTETGSQSSPEVCDTGMVLEEDDDDEEERTGINAVEASSQFGEEDDFDDQLWQKSVERAMLALDTKPTKHILKKPTAEIPQKLSSTEEKQVNKRKAHFHPHSLLLDAALEAEFDLVKEMADKVEDISEATDEGITALHNAVCSGREDIVRFLLEKGAHVNAGDTDGWTPLHCAASCNNASMARLLVEHGASLFATSISDGEIPIQKCEADDDDDKCEQYLIAQQEQLGSVNNGAVYALFSYESDNPDELPLTLNCVLRIVDREPSGEPGWFLATLEENNNNNNNNNNFNVTITDTINDDNNNNNNDNIDSCETTKTGLVPKAYVSCYPLILPQTRLLATKSK